MRLCAVSLFLAAMIALNLPGATAETREWIFPPALRPGDTIALIAPSKPVADRNIDQYVAQLEEMGFHVWLPDNLEARYGYLAGDDETRARNFMEAWLDPDVRAVWAITGGYGTTRFLPLLDYDAIRAHPKILIGMSDITGLHAAIGTETGLVTFLGPNIGTGLNPNRGYTTEWAWRALLNENFVDASGNRMPPGYTYENPGAPDIQRPSQLRKLGSALPIPWTLNPGVAQGRLVGGNLSLIASLVGTPWQVETDGRILVLEDVHEEPYRVDRMLSQLRNAGMFDHCAGVILGTWAGCVAETPSASLSLDEIFDYYFGDRDYPVIVNFATGHVPHQATLPLNCLAELNATDCTVRLLENPVTPKR